MPVHLHKYIVLSDKIIVGDRLEGTCKEAIKGMHGGIEVKRTHITNRTDKLQDKFKHIICA